MGKKKSRNKYTSKGIVGRPMRSRLRHFEEGFTSQKIINQLIAFKAG